ncbi:MAG: M28 family metallopeptidase [Miltoncostaeaceae bacterium]
MLAALVAIGLAACGSDGDTESSTATAPQPIADRFDSARAFEDLVMQVELGPRPMGSPAARRLAEILRERLPEGAIEEGPDGVRNVVGSLPGEAPAILVGAHYDTYDIPGFVGANDGAGGVATVLELARVLAQRDEGGREVRFVLFDAEEAPPGSDDFLADGVRGSRAYLEAHRDEIGEVVVIDFVADRELSLPREEGSDEDLWAELRRAADDVGVSEVFPDETRAEIFDDHTPFAEAGIPAIDLIDFDFPEWHTVEDDLDAVSAESLDAAGEALVLFLERRRTAAR